MSEVAVWHLPKAIAAGVTVSGQVRNDVNSNGDIYEADPGISGVTVRLYQDDGSGNPTGAAIATTTTDSNGNYSFSNIAIGNYVLVETNPVNYASSGDSQGGNDDKIAISVGSFNKTDNVFLDVDTALLDYGDAPNTYSTLSAANGARHTRNGTLFLGTGVTGESNGQPSTTATLDLNDDGVTFSPSLGVNYSTVIQAGIQNTVSVESSGSGYINAWIDYNQDGDFNDSGEQILNNQAVSAGTNSINFSTPPPNTIIHGTTYARFRLSPASVTSASPQGLVSGGEVEDYQVNVAAPVPDGLACSSTGLLNGEFNSPDIGSSTPYLNDFGGSIRTYDEKLVPGWNTTATDNGIELWRTGANSVPAYNSAGQFAEINANQAAALFQDIATVPGSTLTWQFAHRGRGGLDTMDVKAGSPNSPILLRRVATDTSGWVFYRGTYIVPAGQYITRFQFEAVSTGSGNATVGNFIDAVQFSANSCVSPIFPPTIDLDANNSSGATGNNFRGIFAGNAIRSATDSDVTITDDKTNITGATITLTNRPNGNAESLSIDTTAGGTISSGTVTASTYDSSTGRLTLSGNTTLANYAKIISTLRYGNTNSNPNSADRIITVQVTDSDSLRSNLALSILSLRLPPTVDLDSNDSSGASGSDYTNRFFAGSGAVSAADVDVATTDDGANLASATITLTNRPDGNVESLSIDPTAGGTVPSGTITATAYNSTTGQLTLSGNTTLENYQKVLATLKYNNTATNPNPTPRIINVRVVDANHSLTSNTAISTIQINSISLSGTVFNDVDGSKIQNGTESGESGGLRAVLVNTSNQVVASTTIAANGIYTFSNVPANASYTVLVTTNTATVNAPAPAIALPSNWVNTGETLNGTADSTADGKISVTVGTSNVSNVNFGIEQLPDTNNASASAQPNPGGTVKKIVPNLTGSDPEEGFLGSGKRFKIITLPSNGTLYYNGLAVSAGQIIENYTPNLLTIDPNDGAMTISFTYAAVDAASQVDPTPATVSIPFLLPPNLLLVKRITAVRGNSTSNPNDQTPLNQFVDLIDTTSPRKDDDKHPYWITSPTPYLLGAIDAGKIKPGEEIEYTIYFLSSGGVSAQDVQVCDRIPEHLTFIPNAFNTSSAASGGIGGDRGILVSHNSTFAHTNVADGDLGRYYAPGETLPAVCDTTDTTRGAVVVTLGNLPAATGQGTPNTSYGYVRFRARVK